MVIQGGGSGHEGQWMDSGDCQAADIRMWVAGKGRWLSETSTSTSHVCAPAELFPLPGIPLLLLKCMVSLTPGTVHSILQTKKLL